MAAPAGLNEWLQVHNIPAARPIQTSSNRRQLPQCGASSSAETDVLERMARLDRPTLMDLGKS